jgi:hypothetical protein
MVLPSAIGTAATTDGTMERFVMVGMNLRGRTDRCKGVLWFDPFDAWAALRAFDFASNFDPIAPDFSMPIGA